MQDEMTPLAEKIYREKYSMDGLEEWPDTAMRVASNVVGPYFPDKVREVARLITERKFMPGGRYLYASGRPMHQVNNCMLFDVEDSREGWADLMQRITLTLMTGAGIGVVYNKLRERGALVRGMGGTSTGPCALMQMVNEAGRGIVQGGGRRAAIWAGLIWSHPDIMEFIHMKDWSDDIKAMKEKNYDAYAPMDMTNISVILDDEFFAAYDAGDPRAHRVYDSVIEQMLKTGEPGFSVDVGENAGEHLRNSCCEITSKDNNDICNLGSIVLPRVESIEEMAYVTEMGTLFLLCGTLYSMLPFNEVQFVREMNRRLGLGHMGVYEWLMVRGKDYAADDELALWMEEYEKSDEYAWKYADMLGISRPVKTRALAPNGTIAILAGTTSSIEPLFAPAIKRWYFLKDGVTRKYEYVVDSMMEKLIHQGVDPSRIPTAYDMAKDPERRIAFQAWMQQYVDQGISSTLNLPAYDEQNFGPLEFGGMLMKYLPKLRGITAYPNGARGGQPLTAVSYEEAISHTGVEYEETSAEKACISGVCGI